MSKTIYLISMLSNFKTFCIIMVVLSAAFCMLVFCMWADSKSDGPFPACLFKGGLMLLTIFTLGLIFIPSKTEMYVIAGVSQLESSGATEELADTAKLINQYLQNKLKEDSGDK